MSSVRSSPVSISGALYQNDAVSVSTRSRTTSQSSLAMALRCRPALGEPTAGFSPGHEEPLAGAVQHGHDGREDRVVAGQPGQVVEAEVVVGGGPVAEPGLEQADHVGVGAAPEPGRQADVLQVVGQAVVAPGDRHGQVAGEQVVEGGDVGRALDGGVAAQGHDAAAGPAHVAQQQLDDGGGADELDAVGVVGPAHGVGEGAGPLLPRVGAERLGDLQELLPGHAADLLHQLGGVAAEVPLEELEHAAGVLEGRGRCGAGCRGTSLAPPEPWASPPAMRPSREPALLAIGMPSYCQLAGS